METLQPKLRFPEFKDNWKLKQLGDIGNFIGGGTPSTSNEDFWKGDIPWISSSDIFDNEIQDIRMSRFLTKDAIKESATKIIPKNSILLVSRVGVGKLAINKVEVCTSQDFTNIIVSDDNSYFIGYNLISRKNILLNFSQGTSIKGFTSADIKTLEINLPFVQEQTRIANFLSSVDEKLNLLKEKKSLLEEYKKGIMQKIFNQEIRFKDDNGKDFEEWEVKALDDIGNFKVGGDLNKLDFQKEISEKYKYPIYANGAGEGIYGYASTYQYNSNCVTVSGRGNLGYANARIEKFNAIVRLIVIEPNANICPKFLEEVINQIDFAIESTGVPQLTAPQIKNYSISVPCLKEQTKIANFLSAIDEKIELVSNQIQDTQEYKKGLLQQMFV